jgi:hypothetical protein
VNWADALAEIRTILLADTSVKALTEHIYIRGADIVASSPRLVLELRGGGGKENHKHYRGNMAIAAYSRNSNEEALELISAVWKALEGNYTEISGFSHILYMKGQTPQQIPAGEGYGFSQGYEVLAKED